MMKQLCAFMLGANLVGSWLTTLWVIGINDNPMFVWPAISTLATAMLTVAWIINHWED